MKTPSGYCAQGIGFRPCWSRSPLSLLQYQKQKGEWP